MAGILPTELKAEAWDYNVLLVRAASFYFHSHSFPKPAMANKTRALQRRWALINNNDVVTSTYQRPHDDVLVHVPCKLASCSSGDRSMQPDTLWLVTMHKKSLKTYVCMSLPGSRQRLPGHYNVCTAFDRARMMAALFMCWARSTKLGTCVQCMWKKSFRSAPKKTVGRVTRNEVFFQCGLIVLFPPKFGEGRRILFIYFFNFACFHIFDSKHASIILLTRVHDIIPPANDALHGMYRTPCDLIGLPRHLASTARHINMKVFTLGTVLWTCHKRHVQFESKRSAISVELKHLKN